MDVDNSYTLEGEHPKELKNKDKKGDYNVDILRNEIAETENGLVVVGWQTDTGKTFSVLEVGSEYVQEENTVLMFVPGQKLGKKIEDRLTEEHSLKPEKIHRIKGFKRASELYPAEEDKFGKLRELPEEKWTETQKKVYEDMKMGQKPKNIEKKYRREEKDSWEQQFQEHNFKNKFVIAPIQYLKNSKLEPVVEESKFIINDEDLQDKRAIEWDLDINQIQDYIANLLDEHKDVVEKVIAEIKADDGSDLAFDNVDEFSNTAEEDYIEWLKDFDKQLKKNSPAFINDLEELEGRIDKENRSEKELTTIIDGFKLLTNNPLYENWNIVKSIEEILNRTRNRIYQREEDPEEYRHLFQNVPRLSSINKFGAIAKYETFKYRERLDEWPKHKRNAEDFQSNKNVESKEGKIEKGFVNHNGELKPYIKEEDRLVVFNRSFKWENNEKKSLPYIIYEKPVAYKIFEEMAKKPVVITDASFKPEYIDRELENFVKYKARKYDTKKVGRRTWDWIVNKMSEADYWAFHNADNKTPYYPADKLAELTSADEKGVPEADISLRVTWTDVKAEDSTVTRLSHPLAGKGRGRFSKSQINGEDKNKEFEKISKILKLAQKSRKEYAVVSFKTTIEEIRDKYEYFDENNTEYYGNLRGSNNLKGKNLIVIGTAMVNLNDFREEMRRLGFTREEIMNPSRDGEKFVYDNSELKALYEKFTSELMYQAIQRARGMSHELDIYVLGIVPEKIKKEFNYREENWNYFIEKVIVEENGGMDSLVEEALDGGVKVKDILVDEGVKKARYMGILNGLKEKHEDLALKGNDNWKDTKVGIHKHKKNTRDRYEEVVELIKEKPEKVNEMTTSEFIDFVKSELGISSRFIDKDFFEQLEEENIVQRTTGGFGEPKKIRVE